MRITVNVPDSLGHSVKTIAENEKKSVSSLTADALLLYFLEKKKKKFGLELLALAKRRPASREAHRCLERSRLDDDRA